MIADSTASGDSLNILQIEAQAASARQPTPLPGLTTLVLKLTPSTVLASGGNISNGSEKVGQGNYAAI